MTKSMVAPIIAVVVLFIKAVFKIDIPNEVQDQAAVIVVGVVALVTTVHGIFKNHKKDVTK